MYEINPERIGKRLINLRLQKNETREEVANACNLTVSAISNYENGIRVPRDEIKVALANYYNCNIGIFYT